MNDINPPGPPRSLWLWFPYFIVAGLGVVVLVNGAMVYTALRTFPGIAADGVFDRSNAYDRVLDDAKRQEALGWRVDVRIEGGRAMVDLADRAGLPIEGVRLTAVALRPLGQDERTGLSFRAMAPGRYVAETALEGRGQWELRLAAASGQQTLRMTRRIVVP